MATFDIQIPHDKLAEFCQRNYIRSLSLFGSAVKGDLGPGSDVDVLVEFEPGHVPGLALIRMQDELSALLGGREVDLVTAKFLNRRIRNQVLKEATVEYAAG
jgi:uncharacterized protein